MDEVGEWSMALNEHACIKRDSEHIHKFCYSCRLMRTTAIGQQNEGNTLPLKELERLWCSGDRLGAPEKDAINTARKVRRASERSVYKIRTQTQRQSLGLVLWYQTNWHDLNVVSNSGMLS